MWLLLLFLFPHPRRFVGPCFCHGANGTDCMGFWTFGLENGIGIWGPAEKGGTEDKKGKQVMSTPRASTESSFFSHWHCRGRDSGIWRRRTREKEDTGRTGQGIEYQGVFCVRGAGWAGVL